jgi:hypothetical protein
LIYFLKIYINYKMESIRILVIPINNQPFFLQIKNDFIEFQKQINGRYQSYRLKNNKIYEDKMLMLYINEEAILLQLKENQQIKKILNKVIYGQCLLSVIDEDGQEIGFNDNITEEQVTHILKKAL